MGPHGAPWGRVEPRGALVVVVVVVVVMPPHVPRLPYSGLVGVVSANWCEPWPTGWAFTSWS